MKGLDRHGAQLSGSHLPLLYNRSGCMQLYPWLVLPWDLSLSLQVPPSGGRDREGGTGVADGKSRGSKKKSRQSVAPKDSRQPLVLEFGSMFEALKVTLHTLI